MKLYLFKITMLSCFKITCFTFLYKYSLSLFDSFCSLITDFSNSLPQSYKTGINLCLILLRTYFISLFVSSKTGSKLFLIIYSLTISVVIFSIGRIILSFSYIIPPNVNKDAPVYKSTKKLSISSEYVCPVNKKS